MKITVAALLIATLPLSAHTLLVANKSDDTVDLLDPATGKSLATLPTGRAPHEIAVSPDGRTAVIANYGTTTLTVIDVTKEAVVRTIDLAPLTAIDLASGKKVGDVATGSGAEGIAVRPGTNEVWVTNRAADTLSVAGPCGAGVPPAPGVKSRARARARARARKVKSRARARARGNRSTV